MRIIVDHNPDFHHSKVTSEELGVILASLLPTGLDDQVDRLLAVLLGHTHRDSNAIYGAYELAFSNFLHRISLMPHLLVPSRHARYLLLILQGTYGESHRT